MTISQNTENTDRVDVVGACPLDCPDGCSWIVTTENGRGVALRGNPDHPFTRGALCVKTNSYLNYSRHPDRLMHPMRRVGAKGEGKFERISWDEALDEIASRLKETIAEHGGEAIWPYAGTGTVGWIQGIMGAGKRFFNFLGASQHDPTICSATGHKGISYTTGNAAGMDPEDFRHAGLVILWGTNTNVSNRHQWPFVQEARDNGAQVVVIDPVVTQTAKRADKHISIWPGTDTALAFGVMNHLNAIGATNEDFLQEFAIGWSDFRDTVLPNFSPEAVAEICRIDASEVIELAEMIAAAPPCAIRTAMGIQRHAGGGQTARAISCIPALTGDYHRLGGGMCYSTAPCYKLNLDALCGTHLRNKETRSLAMTRLGDNLLELTENPIKALFITAANPLASNPDQNKIKVGLQRDDLFTVVVETFQTDTADYADILLPSTMQTEHADLNDSYSHLYINWNEPAQEPPGECMPHTEIFRRLARKMGLEHEDLYASDDDLARAILSSDHPAALPLTLEDLKANGFLRLAWPKPYQPFLERFETPTGKFEFSSARAEEDGVGRLPNFTPPEEALEPVPEGDEFSLITMANNFMMNSMFSNSPDHKRAGKPTAALNPEDAERLGFEKGTMVKIHNDRGAFKASVVIDAGVRKGVVQTTKGHWPKLHGGSGINATTMERNSDMGRGPVFNDNKVWISPALDNSQTA